MEERIYSFLETEGIYMELNPDDNINQKMKYNCNKKI